MTKCITCHKEQGWRNGLTQMWRGLDSQSAVVCGLSLLVLYSVLRGFSPGIAVLIDLLFDLL